MNSELQWCGTRLTDTRKDNVGVLLKWKVTRWCSNSPPFQPNIEARLLFTKVISTKLRQQSHWKFRAVANKKAAYLIFFVVLLLVSCLISSILFCFVKLSFSGTLEPWGFVSGQEPVYETSGSRNVAPKRADNHFCPNPEVVLVNTIYVWPGGLECAHPPFLSWELGCHTDAKQSGAKTVWGSTTHTGEISNKARRTWKGLFQRLVWGNTHILT